MINIAFLFDKTNDWIKDFFPNELETLKQFKIHKIYDEEMVKGFDVVFVLGYTKILEQKILQSNKLILVVHESDLPKGRGFSPIQWQVLEGNNNITVCLLEVTNKVDGGAIYDKIILKLNGLELYDELRAKQADATFKVIMRFLNSYPNNFAIPQSGDPSFYPRRYPSDSKLDIEKTISEQFNLLRICNNKKWPAFFEFKGKKYILKIEKSHKE